ncbi:hypothetical protein ARMSODRAFT_351536 [Armillaria solidipes]|uniref:Uncharacterized protein n=1 Tax=Armillaria solidipes TaxID=1076256 RepID=A0A2H3B6R2_9AGAR|nr:hypothetical protein ARMSODRAFT_351536 [Armillaria solidipes]
MDVRKECAGRTGPVCGRGVGSGVPTYGENMLGLCGKRRTRLWESERAKTIAERDGLWLCQGMILGDMSIRVQQRCDVGAWSLELGETSRFLVVVDYDWCGFPGSIFKTGRDTTTSE